MPHSRKRHIMPAFQRRLGFSRVVSIQGCRQSGKSFLARELIPELIPQAQYVTFDQKALKTFADENPESFLQKYQESNPLMIDEAQKVPDIFDAVKFQVDLDPRPGQYVLLGSTEFSKQLKIRESLTGRLSRLRLFPLTCSESIELQSGDSPLSHLMLIKPRISRSQLLKHLDRGGFPGIFAVRDESSRQEFFQDWLNLTLERDLHQFPRVSVDTETAREVIQQIVLLPEPNASNIAKAIRKSTRAIQTILGLLETLFVVHKLLPFREGAGKPLYFLCDVGVATHLGASFERQLWTWLLQEQLAQRSYRQDEGWKLYYFRSPKGKFVHLIIENMKLSEIIGIKILSNETYDGRDFELVLAFRKRVEGRYKRVSLITWGPSTYGIVKHHGVSIQCFPWEAIV